MLDVNWFGKWDCVKGSQEILNIIPKKHENFIVKQSFLESGYYNCIPNDLSVTEGNITFSINSIAHKAEYCLTLVNEQTISGTYTQYGETKTIAFKKISDVPEDFDFYYDPPFKIVPKSDLSRLELLKNYQHYLNTLEEPIHYEYTLGEKETTREVIERYHLDELTSGLDDFDLIMELFSFVCHHFKHNGQSGMPQKRDVLSLVTYCDKHDGKINCRGLALILSQLLRVYGIKAAHITCMPYEEPFDDCHVVTICFSQKLNKWIMLDPTWHLYLKNKNGQILNLQELRMALINQEELIPNNEANYYGEPIDLEYYKHYMTKNTFRFQRGQNAYYGCEDRFDDNQVYVLVPSDYLDHFPFTDAQKKEMIGSDFIFWE